MISISLYKYRWVSTTGICLETEDGDGKTHHPSLSVRNLVGLIFQERVESCCSWASLGSTRRIIRRFRGRRHQKAFEVTSTESCSRSSHSQDSKFWVLSASLREITDVVFADSAVIVRGRASLVVTMAGSYMDKRSQATIQTSHRRPRQPRTVQRLFRGNGQ